LSDLRVEALETWTVQYAPGTRAWDTPGLHLRCITLECREYPGGAFNITITVRARKVWQDEKYWHKVQRVGGRYHLLTPNG
jgi:hypothetical protein